MERLNDRQMTLIRLSVRHRRDVLAQWSQSTRFTRDDRAHFASEVAELQALHDVLLAMPAALDPTVVDEMEVK